MVSTFTAEELLELRKYDEEVDAADLSYDDYLSEDFVEDLLFPEKAQMREKRKEYRKECESRAKSDGTYDEQKKKRSKYAKANKDKIRAYQHEWYLKNKERIALQQREYRMKTGLQMTPEEKEKKKAETKPRRKGARGAAVSA